MRAMRQSALVLFRSGSLVASVLAVALAAATTAKGTKYNADLMQLCELAVEQTKPFGGPGWDRHREMMTGSCLSNGGTMPGAVASEASSLELRQPRRGEPDPGGHNMRAPASASIPGRSRACKVTAVRSERRHRRDRRAAARER
jgi:hypothetical protein